MTTSAPLFSVVVPTRGDSAKLDSLLTALERQTLDRNRWELIVAFDAARPSPEIASRLEALRAEVEVLARRQGPGAARNAAARRAAGAILAFTEDDCTPSPDWLQAAAAAFGRDPSADVLEGATLLPDGRPARRRAEGAPTWLPTNLFVRRSLFLEAGGYCDRFFDADDGVYFREDSDLGFTLEERGARVRLDPAPRVTHPREHAHWLDPIRWARRYEMDPLLRARHPVLFRERIEAARWGPLRIRRPFVRACFAHAIAVILGLGALVLREEAAAASLGALAALALLAIWAKWGFAPARLLAVLVVPWVMLGALFHGGRRLRTAGVPLASGTPPSRDAG